MSHRAILIDPATAEVTEFDLEDGLEALQQAVGCETLTTVNASHRGQPLVIWCDDDGRMKRQPGDLGVFMPAWIAGLTLVGRIVLTGLDAEGDTIEPPVTVDTVRRNISYLDAP